MFSGKFILTCLFVMLACNVNSCSGNKSDPASSPVSPQSATTTGSAPLVADNSHYLWGYYLICYDPSDNSVELIPVRDAATHWNVLKFLEQGACTNCVKVKGVIPGPSGTQKFDVEITHPFPSPNLTGFDVRGIAIFHGTQFYPIAGLTVPDRNQGDGELKILMGTHRSTIQALLEVDQEDSRAT